MSKRDQVYRYRLDLLESLLKQAQNLTAPKEVEKPEWDPPSIEDRVTDLDVARMVLVESAERGRAREPENWDEARVWKELYLREYNRSDEMRRVAQKLDDAFAEIEAYDAGQFTNIEDVARRLQLELDL